MPHLHLQPQATSAWGWALARQRSRSHPPRGEAPHMRARTRARGGGFEWSTGGKWQWALRLGHVFFLVLPGLCQRGRSHVGVLAHATKGESAAHTRARACAHVRDLDSLPGTQADTDQKLLLQTLTHLPFDAAHTAGSSAGDRTRPMTINAATRARRHGSRRCARAERSYPKDGG